MQVGQLASILSSKPQETLPSNIETNSRETVQAITLRSGAKLPEQEILQEKQLYRNMVSDTTMLPLVSQYSEQADKQ